MLRVRVVDGYGYRRMIICDNLGTHSLLKFALVIFRKQNWGMANAKYRGKVCIYCKASDLSCLRVSLSLSLCDWAWRERPEKATKMWHGGDRPPLAAAAGAALVGSSLGARSGPSVCLTARGLGQAAFSRRSCCRPAANEMDASS